MNSRKRSVGFMSALLSLQLLVPLPMYAQAAHTFVPAAPTHAPTQNLDLSSSNKTISASTIAGLRSANIKVGGSNLPVTGATMLTPAEYLAVNQVISGGIQKLIIDTLGAASGGSFVFNTQTGRGIGNLNVPAHVTAVDNIAALSSLNVAGDLTNSGTLLAITTNPHLHNANISALDIDNLAGGLITSSLKDARMAGYASAGPVNLNLFAANSITNAGTITSSGSTTLAASSVTNSASVQAATDVNLITGNVVNSGAIAAGTGNINVWTQQLSDIIINNAGGQLSAANGSINVRDASFNGNANTSINGGDLSAQNINLYGGQGAINVNVDKLDGTLNNYGSEAHVTADTKNLTLGTIHVDGDPTYYNDLGSITIVGDITVAEDLSIVAAGNVITAGSVTVINAIDGGGQGHNINIIAGATVDNASTRVGVIGPTPPVAGNATATVTASGGGNGGDIDFTATPGIKINARSIVAGLNGANVTLAAYSGGFGGGHVLLDPTSQIDVSGSGSGNNGNVTVVAGATSGTAITLGSIRAIGTGGAPGQVLVSASQPAYSSGATMTFQTNGSIGTGNTIVESSLNAADIVVGNITSVGGSVAVHTAGNASIGNVDVSGASTGNAGFIGIETSGSTPFNIGGGGTNGSGTLTLNGGSTSGNAGILSVVESGGNGITVTTMPSVVATNGNGGSVTLDATSGPVNFPTGGGPIALSVDAAGAGNAGGFITINGSTLNITGGGTLTLSANSGSPADPAGNITVTTTSNGSDITIGNVPNGLIISATGTGISSTLFPLFDPTGGTPLAGNDDGYDPISFPFSFPFFGAGSFTTGNAGGDNLVSLGNSVAGSCCSVPTLPDNNGVPTIFMYLNDGDTSGANGFKGTWTATNYGTTASAVTYVNTGFCCPSVGSYNAQVVLLNTGNTLGLPAGSVVLDWGTQVTPGGRGTGTVGLSLGSSGTFQTLNPLGIGSSSGVVSSAELASMANRAFAFVPDGLGNYTVHELKTGGGIVSITAGHNLSVDGSAVSLSGSSLTLTAGASGAGALTITGGTVSAGNIALNSAGDITVTGALNSLTKVTAFSVLGQITGGGNVTALTASLSANGNINLANMSVSTLTANSTSAGVLIFNSLPVALTGSNGAAGTFALFNTGSISSDGASTINAPVATLSAGSGGIFALAGTITATTANIFADGDIHNGDIGTVNATTINFQSNGNIGVLGTPVNITAPNVSAQASNGNVFLGSGSDLNLIGTNSADTGAGTFQIDCGGSITSSAVSVLHAFNVALNSSNNINLSGTINATNITLTATNNIDNSGAWTVTNVVLNSTAGSIGSLAPFVLPSCNIQANAFINSTITSAGDLNINAFSSANGPFVMTGNSIVVNSTVSGNAVQLISTGGDVVDNFTISGNTVTLESASDLVLNVDLGAPNGMFLIAGRNIIAGVPGLNITSTSAAGTGALTLVAGASFLDSLGQTTILGPSFTGGSILFNNINSLTTDNGSGNAFNITLVAFAQGPFGGQVSINPGITIGARSAFGTSGNVTVAGGAAAGVAVQVGNVDTTNLSVINGTGNITLIAGQPASGATVTTTGAGTGTVTGSFVGPQVPSGDLVAGNLTTTGGIVTVTSGRNALMGQVQANGVGGDGGSIFITTAGIVPFLIGAGGLNGSLTLSALPDPAGGNGGTISVTDTGGEGIFVLTLPAVSPLGIAGTGSGGSITIDGTSGPVGFPTSGAAIVLSADGSGIGFAGGSIVINGSALNITGGGTLTLSANAGSGFDAPGVIRVTTSSASSDITIGSGPNNLMISAKGSSPGLPSGIFPLFDPTGGTPIPGTDDGYSPVGWSFAFPFFGSGAFTTGQAGGDNLFSFSASPPGVCCNAQPLPNSQAFPAVYLYQNDGDTQLNTPTWTQTTYGTSAFALTFQNTGYCCPSQGKLNAQMALLNTGNALNLPAGSIVLSFGLQNPLTFTSGTVGLDAGDNTHIQTLNPLGIGGANGIITAAQLNTLTNRNFAFVPNGVGGYNVKEIFAPGTISIVAGGNLSADPAALVTSPANTALSLTAGNSGAGSLTIAAGAISAHDIALAAAGNITINGDLSASRAITVNATAGQVTGAGNLVAQSADLGATGNINLNNLSVSTLTALSVSGSVFMTNLLPVTITSINGAFGQYRLLNSGSISSDLGSQINAPTVSLITGGTFQLTGSIIATTGNFQAQGDINDGDLGDLLNIGSTTVQFSNLNLTSLSGSIGPLGTFNVASQNLSFNAPLGTVDITVNNNVNISNVSTSQGSINLAVLGALTTGGVITSLGGGNITITTQSGNSMAFNKNVTTTGTVTLTSGQDLTTSAGAVISGGNMTFSTANGGAMSFGDNVTSTGTVTLTSAGSIDTQGTAVISSTGNLSMTSTAGSIGSAGVLLVNAPSFDASATSAGGGINVSDSFGGNINLGTIANGLGGNITLAATNVANGGFTTTSDISSHNDLTILTPKLTNNNNLIGTDVLVSGSGLTLSGNGTFGKSCLTFQSTSGDFTLAGNANQQITGDTTIVAIGHNFVLANSLGSSSFIGSGAVNVIANGILIGTNATLSGNPVHLTPANNGAGTIANPTGDVVLPSNLVFTGNSLAILAEGNIRAASTVNSINLSSTTGNAGSLTLMAGFDFTGTSNPNFPPVLGSYVITGNSASGGSIFLPNVKINTKTTFAGGTQNNPANAGNVSAFAHGGGTNLGVISLGDINASAPKKNGIGGTVTLIGQGGVQVNGGVNTSGSSAGNVIIYGAAPSVPAGTTITNGILVGPNCIDPLAPVNGAGAAILVTGAINTTGFADTGGNVTLKADSQIQVNGGITTSGTANDIAFALPIAAAGTIAVTSIDSFIAIKGGVTANGLNSAQLVRAGDGGTVILDAGSYVSITGSISAKGANNTKSGGGGNGGNVQAVTQQTSLNPNVFVGSVFVSGAVDVRGGNGAAPKPATGNGGQGGAVTLNAGTVQVMAASAGGASINASAGTGGVPGPVGTVIIDTYVGQPLPTSLDLTSNKATVAALPGGMFAVGTPAVNGTAGPIVSGIGAANAASKTNAGSVVASTPFGVSNQIKINIFNTLPTQQINEICPTCPGNVKTITVLTAGKRTMITPSEALALFETSRGGLIAQTLQINTGVTTGQSAGSVQVDDFEARAVFTKFNLPQFIKVSFNGLTPDVQLPTVATMNGEITFSGIGNNIIDFGSGIMNIGGAAFIKAPNGNLVLSGTGATWNNNGLIQSTDDIFINRGNSATALKFNLVSGSGSVVGAEIDLTPALMPAFKINFVANNGGQFGQVVFSNDQMPTLLTNAAQSNAKTFGAPRPVAITYAATLGSTLQFGGDVSATTLSISSVKTGNTLPSLLINNGAIFAGTGKFSIASAGDLTLGNSDSIISNSNVALSAGGSTVNVGTNAFLSAGSLKFGAPATGVLSASNIASAGSLSITYSGASGLNFFDGDSLVSNGGNVTITETNVAPAGIGFGAPTDHVHLHANGGNIIVLTKGAVGGGHTDFVARAVGATGGGIEVGSGTTKSTLLAAFAKPSGTRIGIANLGPVIITTTVGVVLLNPATASGVNLNGATLTLNRGAIVFDGIGSSPIIDLGGSTFETDASKPISFVEPVGNSEEVIVNTDEDAEGGQWCEGQSLALTKAQ
jgi:hypothetical protein